VYIDLPLAVVLTSSLDSEWQSSFLENLPMDLSQLETPYAPHAHASLSDCQWEEPSFDYSSLFIPKHPLSPPPTTATLFWSTAGINIAHATPSLTNMLQYGAGDPNHSIDLAANVFLSDNDISNIVPWMVFPISWSEVFHHAKLLLLLRLFGVPLYLGEERESFAAACITDAMSQCASLNGRTTEDIGPKYCTSLYFFYYDLSTETEATEDPTPVPPKRPHVKIPMKQLVTQSVRVTSFKAFSYSTKCISS